MARLGAERSFFCRFSLLQEIPYQHQSAFAKGFAVILRRWEAAATPEERDLALLWLGFFPQCLQRRPTRGGKVGRAQIAYRYNLLQNEDWGGLVELWERDEEKEHLAPSPIEKVQIMSTGWPVFRSFFE